MSMTTAELWAATHRARQELATDLETLSDADWRHPTLCGDWDVEHVVAHLSAAASVGRTAWIRSIALAGFRPAVHNQRRLREHVGSSPRNTLAQFRQLTTSTRTPTSDVRPMLGEVLVHAEDIRHPIGIVRRPDTAAATAVAEFFVHKDFAVPSRTHAAGLHLRATDGPFEAGDGPEVTGPTLALLMAMAGRASHLDQLSGTGVERLRERIG